MTNCTEPRSPHIDNGRDCEGHEGMPSQLSMTDCTEPRLPHVDNDRNGEGQKGMQKVSTA